MRLATVFRAVLNWSFLGVILAVVFFYWTQQRHHFDIKIIVENEVNLVEVRERITDLRILYRDQDLLNTGQQLRLLTLTLRNDGETILQQYYDINQPFGVEFPNSKILGIGEITSNSQYLRHNVLPEEKRRPYVSHVHQKDSESVQSDSVEEKELYLEKVIIEQDMFWTVQLYLLQPVSDKPTYIRPFGKIANIDSIPVLYRQETSTSSTKEIETLEYLVLGYLGLFTLVVIIGFVGDFLQKRKKNKILERFLDEHTPLSEKERHIVEIYRTKWSPSLNMLMRMLLQGREVVELSDLVFEYVGKFKSRWYLFVFLLPISIKRLRILALPPEIFTRRDRQVLLNEENRNFVKLFFRQILGIQRAEQAIADNTSDSGG